MFFFVSVKFQRGGHQVKFPAGALDTRARFTLSWFILSYTSGVQVPISPQTSPQQRQRSQGILVLLRMQMWLLPKYIFIDYINRSLFASLCTLGLCTNICIFTIYTVSLVRQVLNAYSARIPSAASCRQITLCTYNHSHYTFSKTGVTSLASSNVCCSPLLQWVISFANSNCCKRSNCVKRLHYHLLHHKIPTQRPLFLKCNYP